MSSSEVSTQRRKLLQLLTVGSVAWGSGAVAATQPGKLVVWYTESSGVQQEVTVALRERLPALMPVEFRLLDARAAQEVGSGVQAHIILGARTLRDWLALKPAWPEPLANIPVLTALVPRGTYQPLASQLPAGSAAIWLDQPAERFAALLALALPRRPRVGVLLGPTHPGWLPELEQAARDANLSLLRSPVVTETRGLFPALSAVLAQADVLLAQPDALLFNSETLQNVLIASFRQRVPVVTFSEPHVRAGATLGLFTTPGDVAVQIEAAVQGWATARRWPADAYAARGRVAVNAQVARSLGLDLPSVEHMETMINRGRR